MGNDPKTPRPKIYDEADVETLGLLYADFQAALERELERRRALRRSVAAIPATAGGILALFIALRPADDSTLVTILYALGLLPFLVIVREAFDVTRLTEATDRLREAPIGASSIRVPSGSDERLLLSPAEYLVLRVEETRLDYHELMRQGSSEFMQTFVHRSTQFLLTAEIIYLVLVTLIAPFIS
jgi:hypothetical protein